ncbi:solute carrier organic anion transporter family member 74D [Daktulosphaira vitifoliae]|uniref:solute carrier organic anion transporter family member 74D n=1 Tax=Daktulosphaira vitifoliae TaxID=58002 RepID=UPI0021A9E4A9|nr:solute carrier organic anion transporter family member 74D [Daktulosphaira vitifoliae]
MMAAFNGTEEKTEEANQETNANLPAVVISDDDNGDIQCGIGLCKPKWMQIFASKQAFLAMFCIGWVLQGMFYTYFVSVITTLEKLFQLQSKTTGIVMSATEIGQIGSSLLLTYYGGQGHRPRWIACGMVLFAVAAFSCSIPHFLFGHHQLVTKYDGPVDGNFTAILPNVCVKPEKGFGVSDQREVCHKSVLSQQETQSKNTQIVLTIFFVSLLVVGMGQTAVYTLGIPFIDDNVASRESPLYFSITIGVRILGPSFGFLLGALCTSLYADLSMEPDILPTDPRWVGAWWLGLVGISVSLLLASLPMFAFPKRLPSAVNEVAVIAIKKPANGEVCTNNGQAVPKAPRLKDFPNAIKRLLKNDILMYRTASSVLHLLPIAGIYTFLPKYFESQFRFPAHTANMVTGIYGIMVMGIGIIISGVFILKKNPNARAVAAWIAFTAVAYAIGMGILMLFGCPMNNFSGLYYNEQNVAKFESHCTNQCMCDQEKFSPICGDDGRTYFSPCHAGCQNLTSINKNSHKFVDCLCMEGNANEAVPGLCDNGCDDTGFWYVALFSMFVFIHSTSEVGSMLLILRCVHPQDKAMALGLIQFAIGLFGNVPCPIIYGAVVDSACMVWEMTCGKPGACTLYNSDLFRIFYHGITGVLMLCAFFVDVIVWYKAGSINFDDEHHLPVNEEELSQLTPITDKTETAV